MKLFEHGKNLDINQPIFFGEGKNVQRYENPKHKFFWDLAERMDSLFWKPAELSLIRDKLDYVELQEHEKHIFDSNLKRQILLDSIQGRSIQQTFGRICTNPEVEYAMERIQYQETNHSAAYSHILRNVYDNPAEVLDDVTINPLIQKHTKNINQYYEKFYQLISLQEVHPEQVTDLEMKTATWLALIAWNILEGTRFYVSFACTFAFAENKKMEGNSKELTLIARDENQHLAFTQKLINILRKDKSEGFQEVIKASEDKVQQMFTDAVKDEIEWAEYLFKDGSILGLNVNILTKYMHFIVNQRLSAIGLKKMYNVHQNPIPWIDSYLGNSKVEVLPQESEISSYIVGALDAHIEEDV
ncbi:MAG: ribonucleotide-diphosphate reductase subunit beta, partial [Clostridiales bacterium]|nr:ribonucleotide-diphosphate reductase subunit beta [Clostridiales bacterium]